MTKSIKDSLYKLMKDYEPTQEDVVQFLDILKNKELAFKQATKLSIPNSEDRKRVFNI